MVERRPPGSPRPPGPHQLQAMAVIHEAMHRVADRYTLAITQAQSPEGGGSPGTTAATDAAGTDTAAPSATARPGDALFASALERLTKEVGAEPVQEALLAYTSEFPPPPVFRDGQPPFDYLQDSDDERDNRDLALEELLLLWLANRNPAFMRHAELFDDWPVARASLYNEIVEGLRRHISRSGGIGGRDLVATLLAPIQASPDSLDGQLRYMRANWPEVADLVDRWEQAPGGSADADLADEDVPEIAVPVAGGGGPGPADAQALHGFHGLDEETERYSLDRDWMPRTVLIAKSTYVWLDQLSRTYGRAIRTLDAIPDEELDRLASQGMTGLWLIGVWSRSVASQRIKQARGNLEAVASAYSLMDYRISDDLGGEGAFADLKARAAARGMRIACDMVPNHMGIDAYWVVDHPERFISRADSPFPSYRFTGPNLSNDERVGIYLEDHYADGSDAAVVFKRVDRWSGEERYVYHGNDGTGMPWNDTAQLDYLREDVREAVISTILAVARRAPIIRFDAAMTLARRHVQRLWYPLPGSGESIPSRAESAMDPAEFAQRMPDEFWREVVDRVAAEAPDTLLLAEAFWLMEGYFVRTLGMHRVYNSAFMHMLRDEKNAEYRLVLKNTLSFDPEILKRYVNFLSNPDERTAIDQFGDGDKYFGAATMLATLPGLPMFGHGQVEGFSERYGMEFQRARLAEEPNPPLVAQHEERIFPLLHRRSLFAEARDFALYDLVADDGGVNEDVFAYSNREGGSSSLIVYHNRYAEVRGRIRESAPMSLPDAGVEGGRRSVTRSLGEALGLPTDDAAWVILRDGRSGVEWLRRCRDVHESGLDVELHAYECRVFIEPQVVIDVDGRYARLAERLGGGATASVEGAMHDALIDPAHAAIGELFEAGSFRRIAGAALGQDDAGAEATLAAERERAAPLLDRVAAAGGGSSGEAASGLDRRLRTLVAMVRGSRRPEAHPTVLVVTRWLGADRSRWATILGLRRGGRPSPRAGRCVRRWYR